MRHAPALVTLASVVTLSTAASAAPGDLLVTEPGNGSVLEFGAGGDLVAAPRFATGLQFPTGICVGPGGDIYVAEFTDPMSSGEVTIITAGGDFFGATPFATGFSGAIALVCDNDTVMVTASNNGYVLDITEGGDFAGMPPFAELEWRTFGLERDGQGSLFVTSGPVSTIVDITGGGIFNGGPPFAFGRQFSVLETFDGMLLSAEFGSGDVLDVTAGGDMSLAMPWATLEWPTEALLAVDSTTLYAVSGNAIFEISAGGDQTAATTFATGLLGVSTGTAGMVHHVCSADADCDDADACSGVETCVSNECVPAMALECDDTDACTADGCDPSTGCVNDPIAGCCLSDADCGADETCSADNVCTPVGGTTGGTTGGPDTTTGGDEAGADDAGIVGGDDDGCSCRANDPTGGLAWLLLGLPLLVGRRRPAAR